MSSLLAHLLRRIKEVVKVIIGRRFDGRRFDLDRQMQILLIHNFRSAMRCGDNLPDFSEIEFSSYSQNGEDGIILLIFSVIGAKSKRVVEICAGDGIECNAANLIINHGWSGLLFDGNADLIKQGKLFFEKPTGAHRLRRLPPTLVHAWITTENVNNLISENGFSDEIDLLSLDMDGVDYWIWKAIKCVSPRVVVLEYNNRWKANQSFTVPDESMFVGTGASVEGEGYFGASLLAFQKLGKEKGYRLIGANSIIAVFSRMRGNRILERLTVQDCNTPHSCDYRYNTNAFFMKNDVGLDIFPEVTVESCLSSDYAVYQHQSKYPLIKDKPIVEI